MSKLTDLLATIVLSNTQAHLIQLRFYNCEGWEEIAACFPKFAEALELLPDTSGFQYCNVMLQDMVLDTIKLLGIDKYQKPGTLP